MFTLTDTPIEPGDIVFVVSHSRGWLASFKRFWQSYTTPRRKHGHFEVTSVCVCSARNEQGLIFYNHQRKLSISEEKLRASLETLTIEELIPKLQRMLEETATKKKEILFQVVEKVLPNFNFTDIPLDEDINTFYENLLNEVSQDKEKLVNLLFFLMKNTKVTEILPASHSSFLVFKHNDPLIRQQFLSHYEKEILITERYQQQGRTRNTWRAFWLINAILNL